MVHNSQQFLIHISFILDSNDLNWLYCIFPFFQPRSALAGSAGPLLTGWRLEDAPQAPSVGPGCLMEAPGMAAPPGTAWPHPNWPLGLPVTMPPR